ncbi:MAG: ACT domain-containing protein [Ruminococcus sp.]|nr:ACT domain-containing protein [Ruminococcus sp.]
MELKTLEGQFSVCKVSSLAGFDMSSRLFFIGRTDRELSLVCPTEDVLEETLRRDDGWKAFRIEGELDFSLTGILAKLSAVLAQQEIGIFAVSTYDTDYILVKSENFDRALSALAQEGYTVI